VSVRKVSVWVELLGLFFVALLRIDVIDEKS